MKKKTLLLVVALLLQSTTFSLFGGKKGASRRARKAAAAETTDPAFQTVFGPALEAAQQEEQAAQVQADAQEAERAKMAELAASAVAVAEAKADASGDEGSDSDSDADEQEGEVVEDAAAGSGVLDAARGWFGLGEDAEAAELKRQQKESAEKMVAFMQAPGVSATMKAIAGATNTMKSKIAKSARQKRHLDRNGNAIEATQRKRASHVFAAITRLSSAQDVLTAKEDGVRVGYEGQEDPAMGAVVYTPRRPQVTHQRYVLPALARAARASLDDPDTLIAHLRKPQTTTTATVVGDGTETTEITKYVVTDKHVRSLSGRASTATLALIEQITANMEGSQDASYANRRVCEHTNRAIFTKLNTLAQLAEIRGLAIDEAAAVQKCAASHKAFVRDTTQIAEREAQAADVELELTWDVPVAMLLGRLQTITDDQFHAEEKGANVAAVVAAVEALVALLEAGDVTADDLDTLVGLTYTIHQRNVHIDPAVMERLHEAVAAQTTRADRHFRAQAQNAADRKVYTDRELVAAALYERTHYGSAMEPVAAETDALAKADVVLGTDE